MDYFINTTIFYGFIAIFTWLLILQLNLNEIKNKLKTLSGEQVDKIKPEMMQQDISVENNQIETITVPQEEIKTEILQKEESQINEPKKKSSFEEKFFGNIFNKIGAIAILIALGILIKIVSPFIIFTAKMKMALGFLSGLGMIFGAFKIQKDEKMKRFSEVLMGTGFGALLLTIYFGAGILNVFNTAIATTLVVLIILAMYFIADKQKTTSLIILALIGGYLNPYFVNHHITMNFLFWYLLFLNVLSIVFVYKNKSKDIINIINLCMTATCIICMSFFKSDSICLYQIVTLWAVYIIYDILCINKEGFSTSKQLRYFNFSILSVLSLLIYHNYNEIGVFLYSVSIIYALLGTVFLYKTQEKENGYFQSCAISTFLTIFFYTKEDDLIRVALWSIEALVVGFLAYKYKLKTFSNYVILIFMSVYFKLFISPDIYDTNYDTPILNDRALYFLAPVLSGGLLGYVAKKANEIKKYEIFKFLSISLIYVYAIFEINSIFIEANLHKDIISYIVPAIFFLYSINFNILLKNIQNKTLYKIAKNLILYFGVLWLLSADLCSNLIGNITPLINLRTIAYSILGLAVFVDYKIYNADWKKYFAIIFGFLYLHFESVNISHYLDGIDWVISVMWVLYAGIISLFGIFKNKKILKLSGIWLSILTIARLFLYDFISLNIIYKLIAFITLGIVLLFVSYIYNKKKA